MMTTEKKPMRGLKDMFGRRFRYGGYSAFAAVFVIAIAVIANLVAGALPTTLTEIDLSGNSLLTLSDQTKQIVSQLNKDVTLTLLATSGSEDATISSLLDRYGALSDHLTVQHVDPNEKPTFLNQYEFDSSRLYQNSVIVECGETYRLVSYVDIYVTTYSMDYSTYNYTSTTNFDGENALTNAIHYVSADSLPTVYLLTGHGETELSDSLTESIEQDNLSHETLSLLTETEVPEDASCVMIVSPTSDLSEDDVAILSTYLDNGGRIVLVTGNFDPADMPNLMTLTGKMGMTAEKGLIIEADRNYCMNRYPYYLLPSMTSHDITDSLSSGNYYVLVPLAQPILVSDETDAAVTTILSTSSSAYIKAEGLETQDISQLDTDEVGTFSVGAVSELGEGKMVWYTSVTMLDENVDGYVSGANTDLIMNTLDWCCDQEETISIRSKSLDSGKLTLTSSESSFWSIIMIGALPLAFIAVGVAVIIWRKRR